MRGSPYKSLRSQGPSFHQSCAVFPTLSWINEEAAFSSGSTFSTVGICCHLVVDRRHGYGGHVIYYSDWDTFESESENFQSLCWDSGWKLGLCQANWNIWNVREQEAIQGFSGEKSGGFPNCSTSYIFSQYEASYTTHLAITALHKANNTTWKSF